MNLEELNEKWEADQKATSERMDIMRQPVEPHRYASEGYYCVRGEHEKCAWTHCQCKCHEVDKVDWFGC